MKHTISLFALAGAMATSAVALATPPRTPTDILSDSALTAAMPGLDEAARSRQVEAARLQALLRAAQNPAQLAKARAVLGRGHTALELEKLTAAGALELVQVEAKIPVTGSSEVYTIILAGAGLEAVDGGVATRLRAAQLSTQARFRQIAGANPSSRAKYLALAASPMLFYSFESIGTNSALGALSTSPDVRVVLPVATLDVQAELSGQRSLRDSMRAPVTRVPP